MRQYGIAIGNYIDCDSALCADCSPAGFAEGDYSEWAGFDGWETPAAIFIDSESDTPTHCAECGELIPHDLTGDGHTYVLDAIESALQGLTGNWPVLIAWFDEYGHNADESELRELISNVLACNAKN